MPPKPNKGVAAAPVPKKQGLTIKGCLFIPQVRTILTLLDLNEIKYEFKDNNIFETGEHTHFNAGHAELNIDGKTILGDAPSLIRYIFLCKNIGGEMQDSLYPKKPSSAEKRRVIDSYLDYVEQMV